MRLALALLVSALLAACTTWPPAGTGGWAEHAVTAPQPPRLAEAQQRFDRLAGGEVGRQRPAAVVETRLLLVRALRSQAAGLEPAADNDLMALEAALAGLEATPRRPRDLFAAAEPAR